MLDFQSGDGSGSSPVSLLPNASQLLMSAAKNNSKRKRAGEGAGSSKGKGAAAGEEGRGRGGVSQKVWRMFLTFCLSRIVFFYCAGEEGKRGGRDVSEGSETVLNVFSFGNCVFYLCFFHGSALGLKKGGKSADKR